MDKNILVQYCELKKEVKDIKARIDKTEREIENLSIVGDSVKGTRQDGTYGSIRISGYPYPALDRRIGLLRKYAIQLRAAEEKLLTLTTQTEEFIQEITDSRKRRIFRLYYIDGLNWYQVARKMNEGLMADAYRMIHDRYLEKF